MEKEYNINDIYREIQGKRKTKKNNKKIKYINLLQNNFLKTQSSGCSRNFSNFSNVKQLKQQLNHKTTETSESSNCRNSINASFILV